MNHRMSSRVEYSNTVVITYRPSSLPFSHGVNEPSRRPVYLGGTRRPPTFCGRLTYPARTTSQAGAVAPRRVSTHPVTTRGLGHAAPPPGLELPLFLLFVFASSCLRLLHLFVFFSPALLLAPIFS